ncbi:O-antigen ligase domain-containing protein [Rhodobacteraceae bacterium RKSG542]|nr:O-antigen ligase family protein [Pseudovibrio flavus]MTI17355.1 O-antigen ligase domain-containing protein [Pseudovibrio flavus]
MPLRIPLSREAFLCSCLFATLALSGLVMFEPSPYELMIAILLVVSVIVGVSLRRDLVPLIGLISLYNVGGLMTIGVANDTKYAITFAAISLFLAVSAILYAAILSDKPERWKTIETGYIAAAVCSAFLAILGYFDAFPGAYDLLTRYGRAKAFFKDPNVFGPFLVLPTCFIIYDILKKPLASSLGKMALLAVLVLGIFLSFSRGAWALLFISAAAVYLLTFINEQSVKGRNKMLGLLLLAAFSLVGLLLAALSVESVSSMFFERAKLVQSYDADRLGRFARYLLGIEFILDKPFGVGPGEFGKVFTEDEHNVYLKGFTTYGWLGGLSYITLVGLTLIKAVPLVFKPRPYQKYTITLLSVFVGHIALGMLIDTDHWRHFYLLLGGLWAIIAMETAYSRTHAFSTRGANPSYLQA